MNNTQGILPVSAQARAIRRKYRDKVPAMSMPQPVRSANDLQESMHGGWTWRTLLQHGGRAKVNTAQVLHCAAAAGAAAVLLLQQQILRFEVPVDNAPKAKTKPCQQHILIVSNISSSPFKAREDKIAPGFLSAQRQKVTGDGFTDATEHKSCSLCVAVLNDLQDGPCIDGRISLGQVPALNNQVKEFASCMPQHHEVMSCERRLLDV